MNKGTKPTGKEPFTVSAYDRKTGKVITGKAGKTVKLITTRTAGFDFVYE